MLQVQWWRQLESSTSPFSWAVGVVLDGVREVVDIDEALRAEGVDLLLTRVSDSGLLPLVEIVLVGVGLEGLARGHGRLAPR